VKPVVDVLGYRDWARRLYTYVPQHRDDSVDMHWHERIEDCCPSASLTFLVGWSEIVPQSFYAQRTVLVLHPSRLPAYRGGSPIQHQIIDGLDESAVTYFVLDDEHPGVDTGNIVWQESYSLLGSLGEVLNRIATTGSRGMRVIIEMWAGSGSQGGFSTRPQGPGGSTRLRRKPEDSELLEGWEQRMTARQAHDFVRALQDPYPNAFVTMKDGRRLYITGTHLEES
jgi:methionyl-tRNA formyltransferase